MAIPPYGGMTNTSGAAEGIVHPVGEMLSDSSRTDPLPWIMRFSGRRARREGTLLFGVRHPNFFGGEMKTQAARRGGNIPAGVDAELGQDVTDVVVNGLRGEVELRGDLGV